MANQVFTRTKPFRSKIATVEDVLSMDQFNLMYELNPNTGTVYNSCTEAQQLAFITNLVDMVRSGGSKIESNFFRDAFGTAKKSVDTTDIWNAYYTDVDYNIVFANSATGTGPGVPTWAQLNRSMHIGDGNFTQPVEGLSIIDKENNIVYQVMEVDTRTPNAHRVLLAPWDETVTVTIRGNKKYFVNPAMIVGGCSCPTPMNSVENLPYVQRVRAFNVRKDWEICEDLLKGYQNIFRFQTKFLMDGTPVDAWDTYEAQKARESLQVSLNALMMFASPITNPALLQGAGAITTDRFTGFYGFIPTLQASAQVIDFAPSEGFSLKTDLQPFILAQDALKRTNRFLVKHGKGFKAGLVDATNELIKNEGLGLYNYEAYERSGQAGKDLVTRYGIDSYYDKALNFYLDFSEWSSMSDQRFIGSEKLSHMAIFLAADGTYDARTNQPIAPVQMYQYGDKMTGDYRESIRHNFEITGCTTIAGSHTESIMMAVHNPDMHLLANPVLYC